MSLETDFFGRFRPAFGRLEENGFRKTATGHIYQEDFLDAQFPADARAVAGSDAGEARVYRRRRISRKQQGGSAAGWDG